MLTWPKVNYKLDQWRATLLYFSSAGTHFLELLVWKVLSPHESDHALHIVHSRGVPRKDEGPVKLKLNQ